MDFVKERSIGMKREDKELLLIDLCARSPYGVKIRIEYPFLKEEEWYSEILYGLDLQRLCIANTSIRLEEFKPYLIPLSSMTPEQKEEERSIKEESYYSFDANGNIYTLQDFYNKNHIDYRGLIEKGLAIEAPKGMYN